LLQLRSLWALLEGMEVAPQRGATLVTAETAQDFFARATGRAVGGHVVHAKTATVTDKADHIRRDYEEQMGKQKLSVRPSESEDRQVDGGIIDGASGINQACGIIGTPC
jgi:galactokinase